MYVRTCLHTAGSVPFKDTCTYVYVLVLHTYVHTRVHTYHGVDTATRSNQQQARMGHHVCEREREYCTYYVRASYYFKVHVYVRTKRGDTCSGT